jgi:TorA-specific chaperone
MTTRTSGSVDRDRNALIAEWLAGLFLRPLAIETVRSLREGPGAALLGALALQPEYGAGARRMRDIVQAGENPAEVARDLSNEFTLLFDGIGGPRTVSPYESAYFGFSHRLFQAPTSKMNSLLRRADVSVSSDVKEPADHLSIELALLGRMMREGASRRNQRALIDLHLMEFTPMFADKCFEADRTGFYAAAADLMLGFLRALRQAFGDGSRPSTLPVADDEIAVALGAGQTAGETPS